jgi:hypothetical protein
MPIEREVGFLAVDEIQMIADRERGHVFVDRLLHARGRNETMFMGAESARPLIRRLVPEAEFVVRPRLSTLTYAGPRKITRLPRRTAIVAFSAAEVYEIAELDSLTSKKEAGVLKALLSSDTDAFRPPYAKGIGRYPRPSVLVGTCNRDDFLNDPTGSRRFWIIDLPHDPAKGEVLDIDRVAKDRNSIFKAALAAYRCGRSRWLTKAQQGDSNQRNLGFEAEHPFMARLADWTDKPANQFPFTTDQALSGSACRSSEQIRGNDLKDAAMCLKALGFVQDATQTRRKGQGRVRYWRRASSDSDASGTNQIPEAD